MCGDATTTGAGGGALEITGFTVGPFDQNCYLLVGPSSRRAALVDPGPGSEALLDRIRDHGLRLEWIVNTHGHVDHVAANGFFKARTGARLIIHPDDVPLAASAKRQMRTLQVVGFGPGLEIQDSPPPDELFDPGRPWIFDGVELEVIHTPGHTPGGVCLRDGDTLIVGDTLFRGSVGRTDLPGASHEQLVASIRDKLFSLPDRTRCYPGHGPTTTIGEERRSNPFVGEASRGWGDQERPWTR